VRGGSNLFIRNFSQNQLLFVVDHEVEKPAGTSTRKLDENSLAGHKVLKSEEWHSGDLQTILFHSILQKQQSTTTLTSTTIMSLLLGLKNNAKVNTAKFTKGPAASSKTFNKVAQGHNFGKTRGFTEQTTTAPAKRERRHRGGDTSSLLPFEEALDLFSDFRRPWGIFDMEQFFPTSSMLRQDLKWKPKADLEETKDNYKITAELPGVSKDNVKVTLEDGVLTVQGERKQEKEEEDKDKKVLRKERFTGSFMRKFLLNEDVDPNGVKASFKDGILDVSVPKVAKPEKQVKSITVE
jgi:HSP20 family protein